MKLKFRYDPFIDDKPENGNVVGIESVSVTYTQMADTDSDRDDVQYLKIDSMSVPGCDEPYYRISLPEGGFWSIEEPEDLEQLINDFKSRLGVKIKKKEPEITLEDITNPNEYDRVAKKVFEIINESCNIPDGQLQMSDMIVDIFVSHGEVEKTFKKIGDELHIDLIDIPRISTIKDLVYEAYTKVKTNQILTDTKVQNYQEHLAEERENIFNEIRGCLETWHHIYKCENEMYRIPAYMDQEIINDLINWLNDKDLIKDYQVDNARIKLTALKASDPSHFTVEKIINLVRAFQEEDAAY